MQTYVRGESMVKEFLENLQVEYEAEYQGILQKRKEIEIQLKENIEFIRLLEKNTDECYQSFTPRDVNSKNKKKIDELKEEQKLIIQELEQIKEKEYSEQERIDQIKEVIVYETNRGKSGSENNDQLDSEFRLKLLETQENERQRISRELHDSTVQNLTSLVHKSELCSKLVDTDPIRCRLELVNLNRSLREVINSTRDMIYDLRPMAFDDIGLNVTIQDWLQKLEHNFSVTISFTTEGDVFAVAPVVEITILRVIQEGCNNAIRHGEADMIHVKLIYESEMITIQIQDNGSGFELEELPKTSREDHSGFGLSMMKERVYLLSGTIQIVSHRGEGTIIVAKIPVKNKEERVND